MTKENQNEKTELNLEESKLWFIEHSFDSNRNYKSGSSTVIAPSFRKALEKFYEILGYDNIWRISSGPKINKNHINTKTPEKIFRECHENHTIWSDTEGKYIPKKCDSCDNLGYVFKKCGKFDIKKHHIKNRNVEKIKETDDPHYSRSLPMRLWDISFSNKDGKMIKERVIAMNFEAALECFDKLHPNVSIYHFSANESYSPLLNEEDL